MTDILQRYQLIPEITNSQNINPDRSITGEGRCISILTLTISFWDIVCMWLSNTLWCVWFSFDFISRLSVFQEYKVSSFEQRLMSEIEFRLERTPVEESDEEVQHDDVPTGRCIAPVFNQKLKNFRAMEGVPVTFSCKIVGIPVPKVRHPWWNPCKSPLKSKINMCVNHQQVYWFKDGKQILKKNVHYKKIRDGDGTCALHIESTTSDDDGNYTVMAANPQVNYFSSVFAREVPVCQIWCPV